MGIDPGLIPRDRHADELAVLRLRRPDRRFAEVVKLFLRDDARLRLHDKRGHLLADFRKRFQVT